MASGAVEGQFDDASPPPSPGGRPPPPSSKGAPPAPSPLDTDGCSPWGSLRTALPPANVGEAPTAAPSAVAIVNALSAEQVASLLAARRAAAGDVDGGDAGAYSDSDDDGSVEGGGSGGDGGASGGCGRGGGLQTGADAAAAVGQQEDEEGEEELPEPCLGLLDTETDASVGAALARAADGYGLDLLAALVGVSAYDRVRAVNWLRARVVRDGLRGADAAAAFARKAAEGVWGGDEALVPVVAGDTLIAEVLAAGEEEEEEEGREGGEGGA